MIGSGTWAIISATTAVLWLGIIVLLHFVRPELDPRTRMVSEYAVGAHGWTMQLAFLCMAVSCWALAAAGWARLPLPGPLLLVLCGVGFAGAGAFNTDPVLPLPTERTQTRSGTLHVLFAFGVMVAFPIAATVFGATSNGVGRFGLSVLAALMWVGLIAFFGAAALSGRRPSIPVGYFERFLILTYTAWPVAAALTLLRTR